VKYLAGGYTEKVCIVHLLSSGVAESQRKARIIVMAKEINPF